MTNPGTTAEQRTPNPFSRKVEDYGFLAAAVVVVFYGLAEALHATGWKIGPCGHDANGFPWGTLIMVTTLALPKVVGRATAGRVWEKVADKVGGG